MQALIYISNPSEAFTPAEIRLLSSDSSSKNAVKGITGFLCFHHQTFIQYIEGEEKILAELYQRIANDSRHTIQFVLTQDDIQTPRFPAWQMKLIESELMSELSVEPFLHKQLALMKSSSLLDDKWQNMIWRGVDIVANHARGV